MAFTQLTKEQAKEEVKKLVDKYLRVIESGRLKSYNEEMTKKEFIEPLFEALGWDIRNTITDDEVLVEERISKGRVDYSFRIGGIPKFFLEAKALKEDLDNPKFIQQAIDYSWHKSCTWAVLTDFEAVKIFNAEWKSLNPLQAQFLSLPCQLFLEKFDQLWLLSKESFEKRLLDSEAEKWGKKIKKVPVDKQLLTDLTRFRELLTKNILKANASKNLSADELDEAVQRIIDRLIFIRTLEDKELEPKLLEPLIRESSNKRLYTQLKESFRKIDDVYNSKLFAFHLIDQDLNVDDDVLEKVINGLFKTTDNTVHYDFSAIDADVLGNIYEQYLGHILKKTEKRAKLSEGKAHRKEQGIYYTPTYVVDYIVKNTIGELAKDKKFDLKNIKVLDPACGSGSFLMKAFDYLVTLDKKRNGDVDQTKLDLTGASATYGRKVEILKNNIFGVDLDTKAVEIAQLNLLLKTAEKKHRLPTLQENIKVGNSLIDNPEMAGTRAFKWKEQFKDIIAEGGFDVVIGNPPYISINQLSSEHREYYSKEFESFVNKGDIFSLFVERSINLFLRDNGMMAFIIPNTILNNSSFKNLRMIILEKCTIEKIVNLKGGVFDSASVDTIIILLRKRKALEKHTIKIYDLSQMKSGAYTEVMQKSWSDNPNYNFFIKSDIFIEKFFNMIKTRSFELGSISLINQGIKTGNDKVYISGEKINDSYKRVLFGRDINRYYINYANKYVLYDRKKLMNPRDEAMFLSDLKIVVQLIRNPSLKRRIIATLDDEQHYNISSLTNIRLTTKDYDYKFVLGLLDSKLVNFFFLTKFIDVNIKPMYLAQIPVPETSLRNQKKLIDLVDKLLISNKRLIALRDKRTDESVKLEKDIQKLDAEIDQEVYKLYGLTKEEIKIIEESLK